MTELWKSITQHANSRPDESAIAVLEQSLTTVLTWAELRQEVAIAVDRLRHDNVSVLALLADNTPAWIVADIACEVLGITLLPLPKFFSPGQLEHVFNSVRVCAVLTDSSAALPEGVRASFESRSIFYGLEYLRTDAAREAHSQQIPPSTRTITFTSGSTGTPKGVCLGQPHLESVVDSILAVTAKCEIERHLCVLPLATLLENVAGVHAPLRQGAQVILAKEDALGFNGASGFSVNKFLRAIHISNPSSLIVIPQLLEVLVLSAAAGWRPPESLQFVAAGGATVSASLLDKAWALKLPVYEGYGLSECGSVVSLNSPDKHRNGTLGFTLDHCQVEIVDNEIVVKGPLFLGYVGDPVSWDSARQFWATGDLGSIDEEGFLHFAGRRKNTLVSSYGRNISPEWVESELTACPEIGQCIVFGDSRPWCVALIAARSSEISDQQLHSIVVAVNDTLPSYARIGNWLRLPTALPRGTGAEADLFTSNGRPRRAQIEQHFNSQLEKLYENKMVTSPTDFPENTRGSE